MDGRNRAASESKKSIQTQERIKVVKEMLKNEQKVSFYLFRLWKEICGLK